MREAGQTDSRIAITGVAFRFPGGAISPDSYWALLNSDHVAISQTPLDRFDISAIYNADPDAPGTTYARRAGYIEGAFEFDASFFRISQAEALAMDPQQRWALQLCWHALENAGVVPSAIRGRNVGVFLASGEVDYARRTVWSGDYTQITTYSGLGANRAILAGRVAHFLGVHGPAIFVDTACSSSLAAVHLAAQSLRSGDCDLALAGGVNLILGPESTITVARLQAMSRAATCRPFDAHADGYMRGEGGGVIVMKRLADALEDGDRIDAVLAGSAINSDGPSNGLTAPNGSAQERVIRRALERAGAAPEAVVYVEAHGTGTPLGDPIELTALRDVYTKNVPRTQPLLIGSVKAQIGHLEAAAGIAGLIKAMLVLRRRCVPAQVNFSAPNPRFGWDGSQICVPRTRHRLLLEQDALAGVSGFGISGTNVHLLLAPPPPVPEAAAQAARDRVLTLSARSREGCLALAKAYRHMLDQEDVALRDLCYTATVRRDHWQHRVALVGASQSDFVQALDDFLQANPTGAWHCAEVPHSKTRRPLVFLFPGQGAWKPGVGAGLYKDNPFFNRFVTKCLQYLDARLAQEVLTALQGEHPETIRHRCGQLAHFIFLYSLARTWMELGHRPDVVIGHSLGEHAAAVIAGVMSIEEGLQAVEARGRLFDTQTPPGAMLAVAASVQELRELLPLLSLGEQLFIAGVNGPEQTVLSGTAEAIDQAYATMSGLERRVSRLATYDTPGHSPLLRSMRADFAAALSGLHFEPPRIKLISTLTGKIADDTIASIEYWLDLVEKPVLFAQALNQLADQDCVFLEVGPGSALSNLARAATGKWDQAISSLADGPDESTEATGFAHACARLYCTGFMPNWAALYRQPPPPAQAPVYPFERTHLELRGSAAIPAFHASHALAPAQPVKSIEEGAPRANILDTIRQIACSVATGSGVLSDTEPLISMGFDSLALTEMRARLQRAFGRALPISVLARGVSITRLAAFFDTAAPAQASPVTVLREGTGDVLALVHPVGGDVLCYQALALAWPGDPTVIGLRHPDVDAAVLERHRPVAELAQLYCRALESVLSRLPDRLGGWSFGGLIAHEMASQWERSGHTAPPLMMIDSPLPTGEFALNMKALMGASATLEPLAAIDALCLDDRLQSLLNKDLELDALRARMDPADFERLWRMYVSNALASSLHVPSRIEAPLAYALAAKGSNGVRADGASASDVRAHLDELSHGAIHVRVFDDDHNSIVQPASAQRLAAFFEGALAVVVVAPERAALKTA